MIPRRFPPPQRLTGSRAPDGTPRRCTWRGRPHLVARVERTWQQQWAWWQGAGEAVDRRYFDLTTRDGLRCVIDEDRAGGGWWLEQVSDAQYGK